MKLDAVDAGGVVVVVVGAENGGAGGLGGGGTGAGFCGGAVVFGGVGAAAPGWLPRLGGTELRPEPPRGPGTLVVAGFGLDEGLAGLAGLVRGGGGRVPSWLGGAVAVADASAGGATASEE